MQEKKIYEGEGYIVTTHRILTPTNVHDTTLYGGVIGCSLYYPPSILDSILNTLFDMDVKDVEISLHYKDKDAPFHKFNAPYKTYPKILQSIDKAAQEHLDEFIKVAQAQKQKEREDMSKLENL